MTDFLLSPIGIAWMYGSLLILGLMHSPRTKKRVRMSANDLGTFFFFVTVCYPAIGVWRILEHLFVSYNAYGTQQEFKHEDQRLERLFAPVARMERANELAAEYRSLPSTDPYSETLNHWTADFMDYLAELYRFDAEELQAKDAHHAPVVDRSRSNATRSTVDSSPERGNVGGTRNRSDHSGTIRADDIESDFVPLLVKSPNDQRVDSDRRGSRVWCESCNVSWTAHPALDPDQARYTCGTCSHRNNVEVLRTPGVNNFWFERSDPIDRGWVAVASATSRLPVKYRKA